MINSRRVTQPTISISSLRSLTEGNGALVYRNGQPFVFIKKVNEKIKYGPVDENSQMIHSESVTLAESEFFLLVEFLELNKEHNIEIVME
jgi:hypothetical protein